MVVSVLAGWQCLIIAGLLMPRLFDIHRRLEVVSLDDLPFTGQNEPGSKDTEITFSPGLGLGWWGNH